MLSGRPPCRFGSNRMAKPSASRPRGTFIQNSSRHPSVGPPSAMRRPPRVGPSAVDSPMVAPNTPNARPRSLPWNSCCTSPSTCGIWMPAATPCRVRPISSVVMSGATAQKMLVSVKAHSPITNMSLREWRSPRRPAGTSVSPNASAYPATMSCSCVDPAPSDSSIDGRPTFTLDRSRMVSAATATQTPNALHRVLSGRAGAGFC